VSLRSPLGRVLGLGSAKEGTGHWYAQRVTAVALVVLGVWLVASLVLLGSAATTYGAVARWLAEPFSAVMCVLLVVVGAYHAMLGLQVVLEDYIGDHGARLVAVVFVKWALIVAALVGVFAVLRIAFGVRA
jgi:succinate dehydrogenase / fumarate reductase membrane anchor subunit